jgi:hypothetical protein
MLKINVNLVELLFKDNNLVKSDIKFIIKI